MKRISRMAGVTLLEIMLVLAIAAMVIVMSVRYYQSASMSQQANATLAQIQAITAAADSLAQGTGTYSAASTSNIAALMPANGLMPAWGGTGITVSSGTGTYSASIPGTPVGVCTALIARLKANKHYTVPASCGSSATAFSYTYTGNI